MEGFVTDDSDDSTSGPPKPELEPELEPEPKPKLGPVAPQALQQPPIEPAPEPAAESEPAAEQPSLPSSSAATAELLALAARGSSARALARARGTLATLPALSDVTNLPRNIPPSYRPNCAGHETLTRHCLCTPRRHHAISSSGRCQRRRRSSAQLGGATYTWRGCGGRAARSRPHDGALAGGARRTVCTRGASLSYGGQRTLSVRLSPLTPRRARHSEHQTVSLNSTPFE
eukprot:SAG11_NODE_3056_length_2724_cov_4.133333_3_plen_231_part_00